MRGTVLRPADLVVGAVSGGLGAVFGAAARLRGAKSLHPRGVVLDATVVRAGLRPRSGCSPWVDEAGEDLAVLRLSRSAGLPAPLPDVLGLALRVAGTGGEPCDLLLSSAGCPPVLRHVLRPAWDPPSVPYTSVMPFASARGSVMVAARPLPGRDGFALCVATPLGPWRRFATVTVDAGPAGSLAGAIATGSDAPVDFDPVLHPMPGLAVPPGLDRLRAAAYAASRRGRAR